MSTRLTAASSKRAREALINLLFPNQQVKKRFSHLEVRVYVNLSSIFRSLTVSYLTSTVLSQLRAAYLKTVHLIHPDKSTTTTQRSSACHQEAHEKFVLLQNAWEEYNESIRMFRQSTNNNNKQDDNFWDDGNNNFTMFGVGCSFSDTPIEREKRNEIMEQASKGWFPSASLSQSGEKSVVDHNESTQSYTKLSDDDLFMQHQTTEEGTSTEVKKTLVQENYKRRRRRNR